MPVECATKNFHKNLHRKYGHPMMNCLAFRFVIQRLLFLSVLNNFFTPILVKSARPSKENQDKIKNMVNEWYKKSPTKRDQGLLPFKGHETVPMLRPSSSIGNDFVDPFSWVEWDNKVGTLSFFHPITRFDDRVQPLQLGQVYQPHLDNRKYELNARPNSRMHPLQHSYESDHYEGHSHHHGGHTYHKHTVHFIPIPIVHHPVEHHDRHEKKDVNSWIWPLLIATFLPIILSAILLPLALILLTNLFMLLSQIISGFGTNQGGGNLVPVFPPGTGGGGTNTNTGRRKRGVNDHQINVSLDRIHQYLVKAIQQYDKE